MIVPELVGTRWYHYLLDNQTASLIKAYLRLSGFRRVVVVSVPWYLKRVAWAGSAFMNGTGWILLMAATEDGRWRPGIGDPTVLGWVTVAAYLAAAWACGVAARHEPMPDGTPTPRLPAVSRFWIVLTGADARGCRDQQAARPPEPGHADRPRPRPGLGAVLRAPRAASRLHHRGCPDLPGSPGRLPLGGAAHAEAAMAGDRRHDLHPRRFVVIRALSFHHFDAFIGARLGGMKWNWILELGGISVVAAAAVRIITAPPPKPPRPDNAMTYFYRTITR